MFKLYILYLKVRCRQFIFSLVSHRLFGTPTRSQSCCRYHHIHQTRTAHICQRLHCRNIVGNSRDMAPLLCQTDKLKKKKKTMKKMSFISLIDIISKFLIKIPCALMDKIPCAFMDKIPCALMDSKVDGYYTWKQMFIGWLYWSLTPL